MFDPACSRRRGVLCKYSMPKLCALASAVGDERRDSAWRACGAWHRVDFGLCGAEVKFVGNLKGAFLCFLWTCLVVRVSGGWSMLGRAFCGRMSTCRVDVVVNCTAAITRPAPTYGGSCWRRIVGSLLSEVVPVVL